MKCLFDHALSEEKGNLEISETMSDLIIYHEDSGVTIRIPQNDISKYLISNKNNNHNLIENSNEEHFTHNKFRIFFPFIASI